MTLEHRMRRLPSRFLRLDDIAANGLPFTGYLIFGAGHRGRLTRKYFATLGAGALCYLDNNQAGFPDGFDGLAVLSPAEGVRRFPDVPVFVASAHYQAIEAQLRRLGAPATYCIPLSSFYTYPPYYREAGAALDAVHGMLEDEASKDVLAGLVKTYVTGDEGHLIVSPYEQYHHPLAGPRDGDVIVDGGAYDGDTLRSFRARITPERMVCFEPTPAVFPRLEAEAARLGGACDCLNLGLWSEAAVLRFCGNAAAPVGNRIAESGTLAIACDSIDNVVDALGLPRVDLIKLDIEGAEMRALDGAARTIERFRPRLQVCVYHDIDDLHAIPLAIRERYPHYRFFLGHHAPDVHETVLYCL